MAWLRNRGANSVTIPDGRTVTPTDDVQILLHCANIWDKAYTTLSALLADTTSLLTVLTTDNSIDYLVRSTTWASGVTADSTAMTYIGQNNYASNTLLSDVTWATAIAESTYWNSVLNAGIPTMTSDTTPSGVCSANNLYSGYYAYYAFDKKINSRTYGNSGGTGGGYYVQYQFPSSFHAYKAYIAVGSNNSTRYNLVVKIQASNDGSAWEDLTTNQTLSVVSGSTTTSYYTINGDYKYFRLYKVSSGGSIRYCVNEFDVYGREDV